MVLRRWEKEAQKFGALNDLITEKLPPENDNQVDISNVSPSSGRTTKGYRSKLQLFKSICGGTVVFNGLIMIMGRQRAVRV